MPIPLSCACGAKMKAPDHLAGKAIKCPKCQSVIKIPGAPMPAGVGAVSQAAAPQQRPAGAPGAAATRPVGTKGKQAGAATMKLTSPIPPIEVPSHIEEEAKRDLEQGEKVLWIGQPLGKAMFVRSLWMALIGLFCLGAATTAFLLLILPLFSKANVASQEYVAIIFPVVFGLAGLCFVYVPFWEMRRAGRCWYLLTNRRAVIHWPKLFGLFHQEYQPQDLLGHFHKSASMGVGDVVFKTDVTIHTTLYTGTGHEAKRVEKSYRGFLAVRNAKQVADVISEALVEPCEKQLGINQTGERKAARTAAGMAVSGGNELDQLDEVNEKDAPGAAALPAELQNWAIPGRFEEKVNAELSRNERVVWAGKPSLIYALANALIIPVIVALFATMTYFGLFDWLLSMIGLKGAEARMGVVGIAMIYCFYGFTLKPLVRFMRARAGCYVLTNKRALVWMGGMLWNSYNIYTPAELSEMRPWNSWFFPDAGDVIFYSETTVTTTRHSRGGRSRMSRTYYYGFMNVRHPKLLCQLVKDVLLKNVVFVTRRA